MHRGLGSACTHPTYPARSPAVSRLGKQGGCTDHLEKQCGRNESELRRCKRLSGGKHARKEAYAFAGRASHHLVGFACRGGDLVNAACGDVANVTSSIAQATLQGYLAMRVIRIDGERRSAKRLRACHGRGSRWPRRLRLSLAHQRDNAAPLTSSTGAG